MRKRFSKKSDSNAKRLRKRFSKKSDSNAKLRFARKQKGELAHGCYILDTEIFFFIGKALLCVNNVAVR